MKKTRQKSMPKKMHGREPVQMNMPMRRPVPSRINGASNEITLIKLCAAGALKVMLCGNIALKL